MGLPVFCDDLWGTSFPIAVGVPSPRSHLKSPPPSDPSCLRGVLYRFWTNVQNPGCPPQTRYSRLTLLAGSVPSPFDSYDP